MQEVITLAVFVVFACFYFKTWPAWNHIAAFICILAAVGFAFWQRVEHRSIRQELFIRKTGMKEIPIPVFMLS